MSTPTARHRLPRAARTAEASMAVVRSEAAPRRAAPPRPVRPGKARSAAAARPSEPAPEPTDTLGVEAAPELAVRSVFRRFWPRTKPYRSRLAICLVLLAVSPGIDAAGIWMFKILVDDVLTPRNFSLFPTVVLAYLAITVSSGAIGFANEYLSTWVGERFVLDLRNDLFSHMHRMSMGFFERRKLGDLLARLSGDVSTIEQLVLSGLMAFISFTVRLLVYGVLLFVINWKLALISLVTAPFFALVSRYFSRRIKSASRETRRRGGTIAAVAEESLNNAALVQAYHQQHAEARRFRKESLGAFAAQMLAARLRAMYTPFVDLFQTAAILAVIGAAVWQLAAGEITIGGLLVFLGYLTQMYSPIRGFAGLVNAAYAASAGAERVIEILDEEPAVQEPATPRPISRAHGTVRVEALSFTYPGTEEPALARIGFTVQPGQKLAVVGPSGAGKTTLTKMLLRFYDPDIGRVSLDGIDLRRLSLADVRRNMSAVLQETLVFDGTVRDNILWGRPDASEGEMTAAAEAADAHRFILDLPEGYDTRVGQRGRLLSGGQRQRLAIARAMIRDAPVLLLDEPTTGLDAASTERVMEPMQRLMDGRTVIVISHNLLTVTDADEILYLDQGRITAAGPHERLLRTSPGYAHLYRLHHGSPEARGPRRAPLLAPHPMSRHAR